MNDLDGFAEITAGIFLAITALLWLLTYLERTLVDPQPRNERDADE